jgi:competence protein ComEC
MVVLCALTSCTHSIANTLNPHILKVHYIDIGQGDSILVQINGKNLLIDSGPTENSSKLISYLSKQNIQKLDYVVVTHPHEDHIGGMSEVIKKYKINSFYAPYVTTTTRAFSNMVKDLKKKELKINSAYAGVSLDLGSGVSCKMLAPNSTSYENLNDYSAVIKITYGNSKFLFMGDAQKLSEEEILQNNMDVSCDVLKIGHHGSSTASSKEFLDMAAPKIAVISCGKGNDYGHPHTATLNSLNSRNIKFYRTDIDGTVVITSDGKTISKQ